MTGGVHRCIALHKSQLFRHRIRYTGFEIKIPEYSKTSKCSIMHIPIVAVSVASNQELGQFSNILFVKVDKGNRAVIMNKQDCGEKL